MRLYLSSTLDDLKDERQAVKDVLGRHYAIVESYEAARRSLWASCVADVASCEIYVGIVGLRYGFVPPGQDKSITELEFEAALAGKPDCYLFVKEAATIPSSLADHYTKEHDPALIEAFRARLSSGANDVTRVAKFKKADDLKVLLLQSVPRPAPGHAERRSTAPDRGDTAPPAPPAMSELQRLLWQYLHKNWRSLSTQQAFTSAKLLAELTAPLSASKVFELARSASVERVLVRTRNFFVARGASPWSAGSGADEIVCSAFVRMALVAAERHVRQKLDADLSVRRDHDPVLSSDHLVACIEAATRLGFGLCFSAARRQPDNVFQLVHPVPEVGVRDEEGLALSRSELWAAIERRAVDPEENLSPGYLRELIQELEEDLGAALVVSTRADGRFETPERRAELQAYLQNAFGVRSFFRQQAIEALPPWVKGIESDLRDTFDRILTIVSPEAGSQAKMIPETPPEQSVPAAVSQPLPSGTS